MNSGLNLSGLDLNDIDIDKFVTNNKDFLDCSLETIFKYNIRDINSMAPYIGILYKCTYKQE